MSEYEFLERLQNMTSRRCWLLYEALRCLPLDRAIDLARSAETFVTGPAVELRIEMDRVDTESRPAAEAPEEPEQLIDAIPSSLPTLGKRPANSRPGLALTSEQREQLLERLKAFGWGLPGKSLSAAIGTATSTRLHRTRPYFQLRRGQQKISCATCASRMMSSCRTSTAHLSLTDGFGSDWQNSLNERTRCDADKRNLNSSWRLVHRSNRGT